MGCRVNKKCRVSKVNKVNKEMECRVSRNADESDSEE